MKYIIKYEITKLNYNTNQKKQITVINKIIINFVK